METSIELTKEHLRVYELEQQLKQLPQAPMPVEHDFIPGVYARTMYLLAGTVLTGEIHRTESFFLMRSGLLAVTVDGGEKLLGPGELLKSTPGSKRAGLAFTDCVLTEFFHNPEELREEKDIRGYFCIPEPKNLVELMEKNRLEAGK